MAQPSGQSDQPEESTRRGRPALGPSRPAPATATGHRPTELRRIRRTRCRPRRGAARQLTKLSERAASPLFPRSAPTHIYVERDRFFGCLLKSFDNSQGHFYGGVISSDVKDVRLFPATVEHRRSRSVVDERYILGADLHPRQRSKGPASGPVAPEFGVAGDFLVRILAVARSGWVSGHSRARLPHEYVVVTRPAPPWSGPVAPGPGSRL
jgi:hypothetical protein